MKKEIICVTCPRGCLLAVELDSGTGQIHTITGEGCNRGIAYAKQEALCPCRILTTSVAVDDTQRRRLPVRSSKPVPLSILKDCVAEIKKIHVRKPVTMHQVIISDIRHTGADMIACMSME